MSGFGVPVKVETLTDINQALINIQRSLSDLFSSLVTVTVQGPPGPAGPPGSGAPGPAGPPGPGGLWFAAQVNAIAARLANNAGVLDVVSVLGVNTGSNAATGIVGEFISSLIPSGASVPMTTGTDVNVTSILLSAGDWDVGGNVGFVPTFGSTIAYLAGGISSVSATMPTPPGSGSFVEFTMPFTAGGSNAFPVGVTRISLATATTVFLVATANYAGGMGAYGFIGARRRR